MDLKHVDINCCCKKSAKDAKEILKSVYGYNVVTLSMFRSEMSNLKLQLKSVEDKQKTGYSNS